jgi:hypothetical protein
MRRWKRKSAVALVEVSCVASRNFTAIVVYLQQC